MNEDDARQRIEAAGCHVNHVSFLERGIRTPTLLLVFRLADALNIDQFAAIGLSGGAPYLLA